MKQAFWTKPNENGLSLSPYNKAMFMAFCKKFTGKDVKITLEDKSPDKSANALGYYWGGILTAIIAHDKGLLHQGALKHNPFILADLVKEKKITKDEIDAKHRDVMLTFRPDMATDLKTGETKRVGQELKSKDNPYLLELITEVFSVYLILCYLFLFYQVRQDERVMF